MPALSLVLKLTCQVQLVGSVKLYTKLWKEYVFARNCSPIKHEEFAPWAEKWSYWFSSSRKTLNKGKRTVNIVNNSFSLSLSLSLSLVLSLYLCLSASPPLCLSASLPLCLSLSPSLSLPLSLSLSLSNLHIWRHLDTYYDLDARSKFIRPMTTRSFVVNFLSSH